LTLDAYAAEAVPPLSDNWYARLFAPRERRTALTAIFACAAEIDGCARGAREGAVARLKLAWWREEVAALAGGAPRHPAAIALAESSRPVARADELWLALVAAAERRVDPTPHPYTAAWLAHCFDAGALHELLALAFDADGTERERARALGAAVAAARSVCSARREAARGRLELPLDALASAGIDPADAASAAWTQPALEMLARMSAEARERLDGAHEAISPGGGLRLQPCLIMEALQRARLEAFVAHDYAADSDAERPLARLWTAWRAARNALRTD
jgi:phytoene synthase